MALWAVLSAAFPQQVVAMLVEKVLVTLLVARMPLEVRCLRMHMMLLSWVVCVRCCSGSRGRGSGWSCRRRRGGETCSKVWLFDVQLCCIVARRPRRERGSASRGGEYSGVGQQWEGAAVGIAGYRVRTEEWKCGHATGLFRSRSLAAVSIAQFSEPAAETWTASSDSESVFGRLAEAFGGGHFWSHDCVSKLSLFQGGLRSASHSCVLGFGLFVCCLVLCFVWFRFVCLCCLPVYDDDGPMDYVQVLSQFSFAALNSRWPGTLICNYCSCNVIQCGKRPGESHEGVGRKKCCGRVFLCGPFWFVFVLLAGLTFSGALVVVAPALCLAVSGFPSGSSDKIGTIQRRLAWPAQGWHAQISINPFPYELEPVTMLFCLCWLFFRLFGFVSLCFCVLCAFGVFVCFFCAWVITLWQYIGLRNGPPPVHFWSHSTADDLRMP